MHPPLPVRARATVGNINGDVTRGNSVVACRPNARRQTGNPIMNTVRQIPDPDHPLLPVARAYVNYFTPTVTGAHNVPETGPALVIGNHSSIYWAPEVWLTYLSMMD